MRPPRPTEGIGPVLVRVTLGQGPAYKRGIPPAMIRPLFVLLALAALPFTGTAQWRFKSGLGCAAGVQAATWRSELTAYRPVPGLTLGLYAPIWTGNRVEIQPDLLLSLGGTAEGLSDGGRSVLRTVHAIMPVGLKFYLDRSFNLQAGMQGGYLIMAGTDGTDAADHLNKLDMGVTVGMGLRSLSGVDVSLRYYNGLSNMLRDDLKIFPADRTLQASVGKRFMRFSHHHLRR